ncbi:MAG: glycosyltransferase family 4 protein [Acidobacteriota bacterium]
MRICLVSQEYPPETGGGGIGTQTYLKAHGLSGRGHEIYVVCASWDSQPRIYQDGNVLIYRVPEPNLKLDGYQESTYWLAYSTSVAEKLHALSQDTSFDIIQFPEYCGEGFVYQTDTFRYRKARYVVQLHGPLAMFAEYMGWPDCDSTLHQIGCFMERTVIHHSDRVLASSHNTAAFCAKRYDYPLDEISVIHSGIDTETFFPWRQPQDERYPKVLFIGNFVESKGFSLLVRAVLRLKTRYPKICLRAVGRGGRSNFLASLKKLIADASAQSNFEFMGYVPYDELPEHYAWCDLFAGPSTYEPGPGNVYLEAMACAKPVIACNSGGAPEVVLDQQTGLLVPPRDIAALENAIIILAEDASLRNQLGKNGREWIEEGFSIEKYINKVERLYKDLIH